MKKKKFKIKAIAPWFGSKRILAPKIVEEFGNHRSYFEPFCGSAAVLLAKKQCAKETLNDLHSDLTNLARVLANKKTAVQLYRRLQRILVHEHIHKDARKRYSLYENDEELDCPNIERAVDYMIIVWIGINGVAGTSISASNFVMKYGSGSHAVLWNSVIESIPGWHQRLRNVDILNHNGMQLLERWEDAKGVVIYVDPPYLKKGGKYVHDFNDEDHSILANLLCRFSETRVIVSYYDDPQLDDLYPDWTKRRLKMTKTMVNIRHHNKDQITTSPEVILINGPSLTEESQEYTDTNLGLFNQGE